MLDPDEFKFQENNLAYFKKLFQTMENNLQCTIIMQISENVILRLSVWLNFTKYLLFDIIYYYIKYIML